MYYAHKKTKVMKIYSFYSFLVIKSNGSVDTKFSSIKMIISIIQKFVFIYLEFCNM